MTAEELVAMPLQRCPGTVVAPHGDDLVLWSSKTAYNLHGHGVGPVVRAILSQIDGKRSIAKIARCLPQLPASWVRELVTQLVEGAILEPLDVNGPGIASRPEKIRGTYTGSPSSSDRSRDGTSTAIGRVGLLGDNAAVETISKALGGVGIATCRVHPASSSVEHLNLLIAVTLGGRLHELNRLNALAVGRHTPLLFAFEHPFRRLIGPVVGRSFGPCFECLRLRLRGAALCTPEEQAVDDAAFSWEAPLLVCPRAPSPVDALFVNAIVDKVLSTIRATDETPADTPPNTGSLVLPGIAETNTGEAEVVTLDEEGVVRRHILLAHPSCRTCGAATGSATAVPGNFPGGPKAHLEQFVDPVLGVLVSVESQHINLDSPTAVKYGTLAKAVGSKTVKAATANVLLPGGAAFSVGTDEACLRAMMEALERYGLQMEPCGPVVRGSYHHLRPTALDPRELVLYSPGQYESAGFPWRAFDPETSLLWVPATCIASGATRFVPADFVYALEGTNHLVQSTGSGAAAHTSRGEATLRGIYEVVERDACLIAWYSRLTPPILDEGGLTVKTAALLAAIRSAGYRVSLLYLALDIDIPVVMCVARRFDGQVPALLLGSGCALDASRAAHKATEELYKTYLAHVRYDWDSYFWRDPGPMEAVLQPWQHLAFYARGAYARELDLLDGSDHTVMLEELPKSNRGTAAELAQALSLLAAMELEALAVDYTPPDLSRLGLVLIKVFVPGLQPMHFGEGFRRLGGDRLFELPARIRRASSRLTADSLNTLPHPFP